MEIEVVDFMKSWMEVGNGRRNNLVVEWGEVPIETKRKKWIE